MSRDSKRRKKLCCAIGTYKKGTLTNGGLTYYQHSAVLLELGLQAVGRRDVKTALKLLYKASNYGSQKGYEYFMFLKSAGRNTELFLDIILCAEKRELGWGTPILVNHKEEKDR